MSRLLRPALLALGIAALQGCGGGGIEATACTGSCGATAPPRLEVADVERVIAQGVAEAQARNASATLAVVDRVGNVLGVFRMTGAATSITIGSGRGVSGGLEGIGVIPDSLAAISKAITGAYLSSEGNAFTSRTASQIVQQFFNPGEFRQPGGPLFGVQFSSLACSDLVQRLGSTRPGVGPQRSPLGLSADPGGFPLYRNGVPIGGVGVIADSSYGADLNVRDTDSDLDELIALAAQRGFAPPDDRRADRITVDGKTLRYSDATAADLLSRATPAFASLDGSAGARLMVPGYTAAGDSSLQAGTRFGLAESGIRPASQPALAALDGFVLVYAADAERFAPKPGSDAASLGSTAPLAATEVQALLEEALKIANRTRAQIRRPLSSQARVSIAVTDTHGAVLGLVRTRDAPVFGTDVALQKARSTAFFSNPAAAGDLAATPDTQYLANSETARIADYLPAYRAFFNQPNALGDGAVAYGARSLGNVARPYFPDGIADGGEHGPLSKTIKSWSVFSTGLQLDLANSAILQHVVFVLGGGGDVLPGQCTAMPSPAGATQSRLGNGLQIFAGGVPIYRGSTLVGAIGISGDGIDQDDMIAFLGLHNAGLRLGGALGNAPPAMRADTIRRGEINLRYVQCPQAPFLDSDEQRPCEGK